MDLFYSQGAVLGEQDSPLAHLALCHSFLLSHLRARTYEDAHSNTLTAPHGPSVYREEPSLFSFLIKHRMNRRRHLTARPNLSHIPFSFARRFRFPCTF
jgi:hypothetical protein